MPVNSAAEIQMSDFFNVILGFMSQFAGSRGGIDHNVVQFGIAATLWGTLLFYARERRKEDNPTRERLLVLGFSFGLARELFMYGMAFVLAMGWVDQELLHVIFPPLEHSLQYVALFIIAGAFLLFLRDDLPLARRYLRWSLASVAICYLATFWWWGRYILANPNSKFGQVWCDWLFHIVACCWLLTALILAVRGPWNRVRSLISLALLTMFVAVSLKIPDMVLNEVYESIFAPIGNSFYLLGIFLLAIVYLREQMLERRTASEQVSRLAYYDSLTKLPNRALFNDRLTQTIAVSARSDGRFALLFLDLDRFKAVNDSHGHSYGDMLLAAVAQRLNQCLRLGDTLARLGGDEFVILLPNIESTEAAVTVAEKVLLQLQKKFRINGLEIFTSTSIGMAFYPDNGEDEDSLLRHADMAMYAAKDDGRGCYHLFSSEMHEAIVQRHTLAEELRLAISRQDFELHFQPQVDVVSEKIIGAEALVRWKHPQKGLIMPGHFISVAEETGQIQALGEWIFRSACEQLRTWLDQGLDNFKLSINLSAHRLEQSNFLDRVEDILQRNNINPNLLELELTESTMLSDMERATALLKMLKMRGFTLAMDDFGTGYSSLSYLKQLPFDQVKIDQSFIRGINVNDDDTMLVKTILSMANHLKLSVVAEGVETYEQFAYLRQLGCDRAQGFYFSRPLPPDDFAESLFSSQLLSSQISLA